MGAQRSGRLAASGTNLRALPDSLLHLKDFDQALFVELQRDGRAPFTTLAARLGVSEAHVRKRVKHLVQTDVFAITAVADPRLLGLDYMAWIGLVTRNSAMRRIAETLAGLPEVDYVVISSGRFNVMAEVACKSSKELYDLVRELRRIPGVQRTETFVYLRLLRQQFQWALDAGARAEGHNRAVSSEPERRALDAMDIDLIRELQRNGRASFRQIAQRLSTSERVISSRFSRLVDQESLQVIAVGNPLSLGFAAMAWLGIAITEGADTETVAGQVAGVRGIDYVVVASGRYDVMAEIVCTSSDELLLILERELGAIGQVANVEVLYYLRLLYKSTAGAWGAGRSLFETEAGKHRRTSTRAAV
jgi:Lrp/AsnC family transcriptional regulator for asnA, asnC and gidA